MEKELSEIYNHFLELLSEKNITDIQRKYIQEGLMRLAKLILK